MRKFTFLKTLLLAVILLVGNVMVWGATYTLVTSTPSDWSGDYLIVSGTGALSGGTSGWGTIETVTVSGSDITTASNISVTISKGGTNGTYYIYQNSNSTYLKEVTSNDFATNATATTDTEWVISLSSGNAQIGCASATTRLLRMNGVSGFRCYTSATGTLPKLYKLVLSGNPSITLSNNGTQVIAAEVNQATTAQVLHKFKLDVTTDPALFTGLTCTTTGNYVASDITNLKVRYSADATLDISDATLSTYTSPGAAGSKTFPSFSSQSIVKDATGYIFITADIAATATHNNTIGVDAITTTDLTFSSGNKTGSTTAGGVQTFKDVTAPTVSVYSPTDGNTAVTVNQDLVLTLNENVKVGTAGSIDIYNSAGLFESIPYDDSRITFSTNTVTINPVGTFAIGANYYVQISNTAITDAAGNAYAGISDMTTWNFTTVAPTVTNVSSTTTNGTYKAGDAINVAVTFTTNITVGGNPQIQLETGTTDQYASYTSGSGSSVINFTYTVQAGDVSADLDYKATSSLSLNEGTLNSADGIAATLTLPALAGVSSIAGQKAIVIDGVAPTASTFTPADNATTATVSQDLTLKFSENIQKGTGNITIKKITGDVVVQTIDVTSADVSISTTTLTINPPADLVLGTQYYINIDATAIKDIAGNGYAGIANTTTWNFTTVAPSVTNVTSTNADGTYKVGDVINVTITFNDNVVVTGSPYILLKMVGTNRQAAYSSGTGTNTLTFSYTLVKDDTSADLDYVATTSLALNGGTINSADGVSVNRTLSLPGAANSLGANNAIIIDCVGPTVSTYNPTDGNTTVTVNQNLVLTFNENVKVGTSGTIVIYNSGGTVFESIPYNDSRITFSTNTVTINPSGTFAYSSDYYVQTTGYPISDMYDNNYAGISIATTWNFTTECGPVSSFPWTENFDALTIPAFPACWYKEGTSDWLTTNNSNNNNDADARSGSQFLRNSYTATNEYIWTPGFSLVADASYDFSFWFAGDTYAGWTGDIFYNTSQTSTGATQLGSSFISSGTTSTKTYAKVLNTFVAPTTGTYYFSIRINATSAPWFISFDDFTLEASATCTTPTSVTTSAITATTATISWTASTSSPTNGYQYEVRTSGTAESGSTGLTTSGTTAAGVVSATITNLAANTSYNVFVRADCGSSDFSAWTTVYSFTTSNLSAPVATAATSITGTGFTANWGEVSGATGYKLDVGTVLGGVLLNQDFEDATFPPTGWLNTNFSRSTTSGDYLNGTAGVICGSNTGVLTTSSTSSPTNLTFYLGRSSNTTAKTLKVNISTTSQSSGFSTIATYDHSNVPVSSYNQYSVDLSAYSSYPNVYIQFEKASSTTSPWRIDDIIIEKQSAFISGYNDLTVSATSQSVTGLSSGTTYYYRIRAAGGNSTSANSSTKAVITAFNAAANASTLPECPTCDIIVASGGELTLDASKTYNSVTVAPQAKLTLNNGFTFTPGTFTLESNASGTGTFVDKRSDATKTDINATVQQYLPTGRNWYVGIPFVNAGNAIVESSLKGAGASSVSHWNEVAGAWVVDYTGALSPGKGYIAVSASGTATNNISFSGVLNTGNIAVPVTRTVAAATKPGFNLISNPYPSYLNPCALITASTKMEPTIWYRTKGTSYSFETVNTTSGVGTSGVTAYIPPMQAFWVRVVPNANPLLDNSETLTFTNNMRFHANPKEGETTITTTPLKAPKATVNKRIRLFVSNGVNSDETVLYTHENAINGFDAYDSRKFSNDNVGIPEIYSVLGSEKLVINGLNTLELNQAVQLGFKTGESGSFVIKAGEQKNLDAETVLVLKDSERNNTEWVLAEGEEYNFTSDAVTSSNRFSVMLKAKGTITGLNNANIRNFSISQTNMGQLRLNYNETLNSNCSVSVYNTVGQQLITKKINSANTLLDINTTKGVYIITILNGENKISKKFVIN